MANNLTLDGKITLLCLFLCETQESSSVVPNPLSPDEINSEFSSFSVIIIQLLSFYFNQSRLLLIKLASVDIIYIVWPLLVNENWFGLFILCLCRANLSLTNIIMLIIQVQLALSDNFYYENSWKYNTEERITWSRYVIREIMKILSQVSKMYLKYRSFGLCIMMPVSSSGPKWSFSFIE